MKVTMLLGTTALTLIFGIAAPAYAQEQHEQQDQPAKPQDGRPSDKPEKQAEPAKTPNDSPHPSNAEAKPPKEEKPKPEPPKTTKTSNQVQQEETNPPKTQQNPEHKQVAQQKPVQPTQRGNRRIPDDKYRSNFGREHTFHVGHPVVVSGQSRFQYEGYSFIYSEPWPSGWGYDDDVYIVDVNGVYYLVNAAHPGPQLTLVVVI
jgi:DNA mismatch repair ATPase MutL